MRLLRFFYLAVAVALASPAVVAAETLVQLNVDSRVIAFLKVPPAALQKWMPAGMEVDAPSKGPAQDANLFLLFIDRPSSLDPEGKPFGGGPNRAVALVVPIKGTPGKSTLAVIRIYSSNPLAVPGPYKNSLPGSVRRQVALDGNAMEPESGEETWTLHPASGGELSLHVKFQRAFPARSKAEQFVHSAAEPAFYRIYRVDQLVDFARSAVPGSADRLRAYHLRVSIPALASLFDGSERLVALATFPVYVRQVFLP
ncbi:MAG TPA: hypothetical protein VFR85_06760 [Anaeromyxobacteraceae bacterium]|nr:hypothetical protein [Anaeromyxobacteraceae bacterium]